MRNWDKFKKIVGVILLALIMLIIFSDVTTITKIKLTNGDVAKSKICEQYFINTKNEEKKIDLFKGYMSLDGWEFSEIYYDKIFFRKGNLQKEIQINSLIMI